MNRPDRTRRVASACAHVTFVFGRKACFISHFKNISQFLFSFFLSNHSKAGPYS